MEEAEGDGARCATHAYAALTPGSTEDPLAAFALKDPLNRAKNTLSHTAVAGAESATHPPPPSARQGGFANDELESVTPMEKP